MSSIAIAGIGIATVFSGLIFLILVLSLFPLFFKEKTVQSKSQPAAAPSAPAVDKAKEDEMAAVVAAALAMYEEDEMRNPFIRNL